MKNSMRAVTKSMIISMICLFFVGSAISAQEVELKDTDEVLELADQMPCFPGCENVFSDEEKSACSQRKILGYVFSNLKYPAAAREEGIMGTVKVQFVIAKDGKMKNISLIQELGGGCSEEVLRVFKRMSEETLWIPAKDNGEAVNLRYTVPVKFSL